MNANQVTRALYAAMRAGSRADLARPPLTADQGSRIRRLVVQRHADDGDPVVGHKIGLGTADAQAHYGVTSPGRGYLFRSQVLESGAHVDTGELSLLVEPEIAVTMGSDVTLADASSDTRLLQAVAYAQTAIEVVGSRWHPSPGGSIGAWMADNGMAVRTVLGRQRVPLSVGEVTVDMTVSGEPREDRAVPAVADNLRWLVRDLAEDGESLRRGMVVLTGALIPPIPVDTEADVDVHVAGYGSVSAHIRHRRA